MHEAISSVKIGVQEGQGVLHKFIKDYFAKLRIVFRSFRIQSRLLIRVLFYIMTLGVCMEF